MPDKIRDERGGMPSASKMTRIFNCPASYKLNAAETPENSGAAVEGTMLHRHMELTYMPAKTPEQDAELKALGAALNSEQTQALAFAENEVEKVAHFFDGERHTEQRLWAANMTYSGQADMLVISPDKKSVVIVDYKFGRGEVEPAERNYQLAALAVLAADNYGVENVRAMIIQPRALDKARRITACEYIVSDIEQAREAIDSAVKSALYAKQPREAVGYWCNYCPSAYRCAAAQKVMDDESALVAKGFEITPDNVREVFEKAKFVGKMCADIVKKCGEVVSENPDLETGLYFAPNSPIRSIPDTLGALRVVEEKLGRELTDDELCRLVQFKIGELERFFTAEMKAANPDAKITKKALAEAFGKALKERGLIEYSAKAPSLKVKE